jgi:hypothetical protein
MGRKLSMKGRVALTPALGAVSPGEYNCEVERNDEAQISMSNHT